MAAEPEPTEVDAEQLRKAQVWLQSTKDYIDQQILVNLRTIPGMVRGAHVNPDDQQSTMAADASSTPTANTSGVAVTGLVTKLGPTHFGLFPNGLDMATRHINSYNSTLTGLTKVSADLKKAIDATAYILKNYEDNEEITATDLSKIMTNPPYEPPPANPGATAHHDPSNPNHHGGAFI